MIISVNLVFITLKITTLRAESFAVRKFREFREFWPFSRKFMPLDMVIGENRESFSAKFESKSRFAKVFSAKFHLNMVDLIMIYFCQVNRTTKHGHQTDHSSILPAFNLIQWKLFLTLLS